MEGNGSANTLQNMTFTNETARNVTLAPLWSFTPTFLLVFCILGSITNFNALLLFFKNFRAPFDIYVINLLGTNLTCVLLQYPFAIKSSLFNSRWTMGNQACSFYLYCQCVIDAGIINSHAVIAVNRAWAIIRPMSFRAAHTKRFTLTVCLIMWLYIHLVVGSFWLADTLYYRTGVPVTACLFNTVQLNTWSNVNDIIVYISPLAVTLLSFFVVMVSKLLRSREAMKRSARVKPQNAGVPNIQAQIPPKTFTFISKKETNTVAAAAIAVEASNGREVLTGIRGRRSGKYAMLTLLTISIVVFTMPDMIYFLLVGFLPDFWIPEFFEVTNSLFVCQTVVDPILFVLTMDKLRVSQFRQ
ncbi:hypothetical protein BV898_15658 [Hypsibius exemplaris]|uniref:G-protein coupled receptors family 1 profile domain-containing protein n=1 Tax=Hypsibius exemplaris TaxID=2072580 RepID=A0A9X6ND80_HYPEX|nr:hypothetical protein BV898_15658 [Hypsibius exemplaris]